MDNKNSYYGSDEIETISYLEFGSINIQKGKKEIWGYWQDQTAYDFYMFSRYARDLFSFRNYFKESEKNVEVLNNYILNSAHTKLLDYIFKYAGVLTSITDCRKSNIICESGSSLYGLIDECIACDYTYQHGKNVDKINNMKYLCSDISDMMNRGAEAFHNGIEFNFSTADTISKLLDEVDSLALFYGLSVSLRYALREAQDILKIAQKSELVIFNRLSLSLGDTFKLTYGTGKYVFVLSLPELIKLLEKNGIEAKYCTANMQFNKDGRDSVRASIAISSDLNKVENFIYNYEDCINKSKMIAGIEQGEWKSLRDLLK